MVAVGDELLNGAVTDTNTGEIGAALLPAGGTLVWATAVPDDVAAIGAALRAAVRVAALVVVTGGLGPTSDDLTGLALAAVADAAPTPLHNPVGTAPGLLATVDGVPVVAVPGVPAEMRVLVDREVLPRLPTGAVPVSVAQLTVALRGETQVAAAIDAVTGDLPPDVRVAYLAGPGQVRVRFVGTGDVAGCAERARDLLGDDVCAIGNDTLEQAVVGQLAERGATVATAESLTGGLVGAALTDVPGSSAVYVGGVVVYATRLKAQLAGVDLELLDRLGPVHPQVAAALAAGVRDRLAATYGLATTGVAGPAPQGGHAAGTFFVAVAGPAGVRVAQLSRPGPRELVRRRAVVTALDLLRRSVGRLPASPAEVSA